MERRVGDGYRLCGGLLEVGDEVVAVIGLLETTERHLGARNVLLGVLEVLELQKWSVTCSNYQYR